MLKEFTHTDAETSGRRGRGREPTMAKALLMNI